MAFPSFGEACLAQALKVAPSPHHGQRSEMKVNNLFESLEKRFKTTHYIISYLANYIISIIS